MDRSLHLGFSPSVFLVELLSGLHLLPAIDYWYASWIATIFFAWAWAAAQPDDRRRRNFALGFGLLSVLGAWIYLAAPALGPCFVTPDLFAGHAEELHHAAATQARLARN